MATLKEIIYGYKNYRRGGVQSQSESLDDRLVAFSVNYYRAKLFKESLEKGRNVIGSFSQPLGEVVLINADKNENCSINECILRTETTIPTPIYTGLSSLLSYVGSTDGENPFSKTSYTGAFLTKYAKYTSWTPKYYDLNK